MARNIDISVFHDNLAKSKIKHEEYALESWPEKHGWIINEQIKLKSEIKRIEKMSPFYEPKVEFYDPRNLKPFPKTTASEVGWASGKREFNLEIYGPYYEKMKDINNIEFLTESD